MKLYTLKEIMQQAAEKGYTRFSWDGDVYELRPEACEDQGEFYWLDESTFTDNDPRCGIPTYLMA